MRKAAMMSKVVDGAFESPEDIEVRSLGGECHRRRGQRSLAIESSAGEDCASQEMSDRLQESFVTQHSHSGMASGWPAERFHRSGISACGALLRRTGEGARPHTFSSYSVGCTCGTSTVRASGTIDNVIGNRPSNSPSAST